MQCTICGDNAKFICPCGLQSYCENYDCVDEHLELCGEQSIGVGPSEASSTTETSTSTKTSRTVSLADTLLSPEKSAADFKKNVKSLYRPFHYPYKVLHYDRCNLKSLRLTRDSSISITKDSSPQRFNRDFRGPWTPLRGGILSFPTGSGKTRLMHAILGNYNRVKTEMFDPKTGTHEMRFKQLIYVTKTELVVDARKDFAAQKDRSQDIVTKLLKDHNIPHSDENEFAPFNPRVNIMSYRTFSNMLEGENPAGRKFWAGFQITDTSAVVQANELIQGVPTAYHQMFDGTWQRGALPHNWADLQQGRPAISFRVRRTSRSGKLPNLDSGRYSEQFIERFVKDWAVFKRGMKNAGDYNLRSLQIDMNRISNATIDMIFQSLWEGLIPPQKLWERFVSAYGRQTVRDVITGSLRGLTISITAFTILRELPAESELSKEKDWKLVKKTVKKKDYYSWEPVVDPSPEEFLLVAAAQQFNPVDNLVVVFDEGDLLFNREKLLAGERAKTELIVKALRESHATAFFGSGTIDLFPRLSMLSALTPLSREPRTRFPYEPFEIRDLSGAVKLTYTEVREFLQQFLDPAKKTLALNDDFKNQFKGLTSHSTVEGMRDFFPEFLFDAYDESEPKYTHFVPLPLEHAQLVTEAIPLVSPSTLMQRISYSGSHEDRLDISSPRFDPQFAYNYLVREQHMPILSQLLADLRSHDQEEFSDWNSSDIPLSRRAIMSSLADDADGIAKVAAAMVAVGYRWLPLVPNKNQIDKEERRKMRMKGEKLPDRMRTMMFGEFFENPAENIDPSHRPFTSDGQAAPAIVVLSENLFAQRAKQAFEIQNYAALGEYARERSFKTPYKFKGAGKLQTLSRNEKFAALRDTALRQMIAKNSVFYYDATQESRSVAGKVWQNDYAYLNFFDEQKGLPTLYVRKTGFDEIEGRRRQLPVKVDLGLEFEEFFQLVEVSVVLSSMEREDAKELIIDYTNSLEWKKDNTRFSLVGRKIGGQGIDIFRATVGYNIDVAPDYRTQIQRRGRLGRRCGHRDLEFERHFVALHTYVSTWPTGFDAPTFEEIGKNLDEEFADDRDEDDEDHLEGEKEAVRAIEVDPLTVNSKTKYESEDRLLPYEVVRILSEEPALTRLRLWGEKEFDTMAIDEDYNKILLDSETKPVYSNTNYILNVGRMVENLNSFIEDAKKNVAESAVNLQIALRQLEEQRDATVAEVAATGDVTKIVAVVTQYKEEEVDLKEQYKPEILESRVLEAEAVLDVFKTLAEKRGQVSIWRHVTEEKTNRQLIVVDKSLIILRPTYFGQPKNFDVLSLLQHLVDKRYASWNPKIIPQPNPAKRPGGAKESDPKRVAVALQRLLSPFLIGAEDEEEEAPPFVSFGNVIETTNFADEEQEAIEEAAAVRFEAVARELGIWENTITKANPSRDAWVFSEEEEIVAYLYQILKGGAANQATATALKKAILELYSNGVMNWNRGLELFAHVLSAMREDIPNGTKETLDFVESAGQLCASLYSYALGNSKAQETLVVLTGGVLSLEFPRTTGKLSALVETLSWWSENREEPIEFFLQDLQKNYYIDVKNSWSDVQRALQNNRLRKNFELSTFFTVINSIVLVDTEQTRAATVDIYLKQLKLGVDVVRALARSSPEYENKTKLIDVLTDNLPSDTYSVLYPKSTREIIRFLAQSEYEVYTTPLEKLIKTAREKRTEPEREFYIDLISSAWEDANKSLTFKQLSNAVKFKKAAVVATGFKSTVAGAPGKLFKREDQPDKVFYKKGAEFPHPLTVESYKRGYILFEGDANQLSVTFRQALLDDLASQDTPLAQMLAIPKDRKALENRIAEFIKNRAYDILALYATENAAMHQYIDFVIAFNSKRLRKLSKIQKNFAKLEPTFKVQSLLFQKLDETQFKLDFNAKDKPLYRSILRWLLDQDEVEPLLKKKLLIFADSFTSSKRMVPALASNFKSQNPWSATLDAQKKKTLDAIENASIE